MEDRNLIYVIIAVLLAVVLFKLFMWLWPIIVILIIAFFIYAGFFNRYY